jgi:hypothetical protein
MLKLPGNITNYTHKPINLNHFIFPLHDACLAYGLQDSQGNHTQSSEEASKSTVIA